MDFTILGSFEVCAQGRRLEVGSWKPRIVLGLLLCRANHVVPVPVLREALWEDNPPRTAHKNLQGYVSGLRSLLRGGAELIHRPPGYLLRVGAGQVDALRFAELARRGREAFRARDLETAADLLDQAVRLWRGAVLPDLAAVPVVAEEADRLQEKYLGVVEDWAEAGLALGRHAGLVDRLDELAALHPFRERLRHAQMLALYRSGRATDALGSFDAMRQHLARELGLDPSPPLTRLYERMLAADSSLDPKKPTHVRETTAFTGRSAEIEAVSEALKRPGAVVAIAGAAGVGKTALALHCAQKLVRLRTANGEARPDSEILAEIGPGGSPLILDDAGGEDQVRRLRAAAGGRALIVTSRRRLTGLTGATHLRLEPLTPIDGVRLLERLVGEQRTAAERPAAYRLVELCGGLPLALRIAGAKLAAVPHLPLARYADRLADERRVVDRLCAGDLQVRPHLARWLSEVDPGDREVLRRLAGSAEAEFSTSEAATSLGGDPGDVEDAIERLFEAHLIETRIPEVQAHAAAQTVRFAVPTLLRALLREAA